MPTVLILGKGKHVSFEGVLKLATLGMVVTSIRTGSEQAQMWSERERQQLWADGMGLSTPLQMQIPFILGVKNDTWAGLTPSLFTWPSSADPGLARRRAWQVALGHKCS